MAEPGRWITANMGFLVGQVTVIKDSYKKFIGIDASSNDMPRPSIYGAYHHISFLGPSVAPSGTAKPDLEPTPLARTLDGLLDTINPAKKVKKNEIVSVVGSICENNDQFAKDRELPVCEVGDIVVIHNSGGHAYAMGHNYNGKLRHAEYLLCTDYSFKKIRRAETFEDLYRTVDF